MSIATVDGWSPSQITHEMGFTKVLHALSDLDSVGPALSDDDAEPAPVGRQMSAAGTRPKASEAPPLAMSPIDILGRPAAGYEYRDVEFPAGTTSLGMMLSPIGATCTEPMVVNVVEGSPSNLAGVQVEDVVVGITPAIAFKAPPGASDAARRLRPGVFSTVADHEEAMSVMPFMGRPVRVTFLVPTRSSSSRSSSSGATTTTTSSRWPSVAPRDQAATEPAGRGAGEESSSLEWECSTCTFHNPASSSGACEMCGSLAPKAKAASPQPARSPESAAPVKQPVAQLVAPAELAAAVTAVEWVCAVCTFANGSGSQSCDMCGSPCPPVPASAPASAPASLDEASPPPVSAASAEGRAVWGEGADAGGSVWQEVESDEYPGHNYFLNSATGEAQWEKPEGFIAAAPSEASLAEAAEAPAVASPSASTDLVGATFPADVTKWARSSLGLSAEQEHDFLVALCGRGSKFGVTEMSDLKNIDLEHLEQVLNLVPIAKRKKFERALEMVRSTDFKLG